MLKVHSIQINNGADLSSEYSEQNRWSSTQHYVENRKPTAAEISISINLLFLMRSKIFLCGQPRHKMRWDVQLQACNKQRSCMKELWASSLQPVMRNHESCVQEAWFQLRSCCHLAWGKRTKHPANPVNYVHRPWNLVNTRQT